MCVCVCRLSFIVAKMFTDILLGTIDTWCLLFNNKNMFSPAWIMIQNYFAMSMMCSLAGFCLTFDSLMSTRNSTELSHKLLCLFVFRCKISDQVLNNVECLFDLRQKLLCLERGQSLFHSVVFNNKENHWLLHLHLSITMALCHILFSCSLQISFVNMNKI